MSRCDQEGEGIKRKWPGGNSLRSCSDLQGEGGLVMVGRLTVVTGLGTDGPRVSYTRHFMEIGDLGAAV